MKVSKRDYIFRFVTSASKQGSLLVSSLIGAKLLGIRDYGQLSYILTIVSILLMLSDFGFSTAITKEVAFSKDKKRLAKVINSGLLFILMMFSFVSLVFISFKQFKIIDLDIGLLVLTLAVVFFSLLSSFIESVLRGMGRFKESSVAAFISIVVSLPLQILFISKYKLLGAISSQVLFSLLYYILLQATSKMKYGFKSEPLIMKKILKYSFQYGIASISYFLFSRYLILVLGQFHQWDVIAIYDLLSKTMLVFTFPITIYGQVISPSFSKKEVLEDHSILKHETVRYTKVLTWLSLFIAIAFYLLGLLVKFLLPDFGSSASYDFVLIISSMLLYVYSWTNMIDTGIIVPTGHAYIMSYVYPLIAILSIGSLPIVGNIYGYKGILGLTIIFQVVMALIVRLLFIKNLNREVSLQES